MENKKILRLTYDVPISCNQYLAPAADVYRIKGKTFAKAYLYETDIAKKYKLNFTLYARREMKKQGWEHEEGRFVHVDMTVYFDRTNRDSNNLWKLLADSLTNSGIIKDDNIVLERTKRVYYDRSNARVEIEIYHSDTVGVFDTEEDYQIFINKCATCSRYANNCSILVGAKESRIQDDVTLNQDTNKWECQKHKEIKTPKPPKETKETKETKAKKTKKETT